MPITKRTTKAVSYHEQDDDDDDFIPIVDNTKKNRNSKSNDPIQKSSRKHNEKLCTTDQEEPVLILQPPKENIIIIDDKENTNSQSTVSSDDNNKTSSEHLTDVDDQDDHLSPKIKRMKHVEEENIHENEEEHSPQKQSIDEREQIRKKNAQTSDLPKRGSSVSIGFPTSKINIPSPHVPRVGLSRKSSTIKPLHPNFPTRTVHE